MNIFKQFMKKKNIKLINHSRKNLVINKVKSNCKISLLFIINILKHIFKILLLFKINFQILNWKDGKLFKILVLNSLCLKFLLFVIYNMI